MATIINIKDYFLQVLPSLTLKYQNAVQSYRELIEKEEKRGNEVILISIPQGSRKEAVEIIENALNDQLLGE